MLKEQIISTDNHQMPSPKPSEQQQDIINNTNTIESPKEPFDKLSHNPKELKPILPINEHSSEDNKTESQSKCFPLSLETKVPNENISEEKRKESVNIEDGIINNYQNNPQFNKTNNDEKLIVSPNYELPYENETNKESISDKKQIVIDNKKEEIDNNKPFIKQITNEKDKIIPEKTKEELFEHNEPEEKLNKELLNKGILSSRQKSIYLEHLQKYALSHKTNNPKYCIAEDCCVI